MCLPFLNLFFFRTELKHQRKTMSSFLQTIEESKDFLIRSLGCLPLHCFTFFAKIYVRIQGSKLSQDSSSKDDDPAEIDRGWSVHISEKKGVTDLTQRTEAQKGVTTKEMKRIIREEEVSSEWLREKIVSGRIAIPANPNHKGLQAIGIGEGLRIKVNTNLGTSSDHVDVEEELKKLEVSLQAGTDTVMDLSTGGDIKAIREAILQHSPVPVGTVPIYEAAVEAVKKRKALTKMRAEDLFEAIERQAEEGVDFITVHCGVTRTAVERLKRDHRLMGVVSRGILPRGMDDL